MDRNGIVLAWASPPCETYSRANWSNLSRGFNYRKLEPGFPPVEGERGRKAAQHDRLTQPIKEVLDLVGCYVMENQQGGMEKMLYMANWEDKKKIINRRVCVHMAVQEDHQPVGTWVQVESTRYHRQRQV